MARHFVNLLDPLPKQTGVCSSFVSHLQFVEARDLEVEPIAIVGLGCRFPGAHNPAAFWQLLQRGGDAITTVPPERWDIDAFYHSEPGIPGKMSTRYGGFIDRVADFDADFFGISPREAAHIDPQQRLVLEVTWEALEHAGIVPSTLAGSQTGVFIGCGNYDYGLLMAKDHNAIDAYVGTGITIGIAANRVSYLLDLRGPSLTIETSCSSSLVALHLACQSLRNRESDVCLAGAVSLMLSPEQTITYSQAKMMAADGRCKTFDASANGYVRGEGCGVVVLKRLTNAVADRDPIRAVIRGSAVNQDGLTNGLTAPNGPSQKAVIRQALDNAGVSPAEISYVETHGTGTPLGDPIEVRSLKTVLMQGRRDDQPCWLGSVKTNIGHLEAAAGMAGLLKVILSLQHQAIPPHLHLKQLNPYISLEGTPFSIPTELQPWPVGSQPRFAGISSFGFGGTNAHLILEEAPPAPVVATENSPPLHLLTLTAKSESALQQMAQQYGEFLAANPNCSLADICFTANTRRSQFEHRLGVVADSVGRMRQQLQAFATHAATAESSQGKVQKGKRPQIAFLFTGQGSQAVNMGRDLCETQPIFRQTLDRCDQILRAYLEKPLLEILYPAADEVDDSESLLHETAYTQPALFALEYALAQVWQSWGIQPDVVMGHSVGEYVAACVAGVLSLEDALKLIAARARLMQALPPGGEMVAVMADETRVLQAMQPFVNEVAIAAINGPTNVVISGKRQAIATICPLLEADGIKTKPLQVSHAFHSPLMEPMLTEFEQVASSIGYSPPQLGLISNVTGKLATTEVTEPQYWCQHVRKTVRFAEGMATLQQRKCQVMIEIGPKPILLGMGRACLSAAETQQWSFLPSLRPGQSDRQQMLQSLAEVFVRGGAVNWQAVQKGDEYRHVVLPTYPFQRRHYWLSAKTSDRNHNSHLENQQSQIAALLSQGETQQLTEQLATELSPDDAASLPRILEVLIQQHQQQINATTVQDWFYQIEWQAKTRDRQPSATLDTTNGSWLILADRDGVGLTLAEQLRQQGERCFLVYAGKSDTKDDSDTWSLDPSCPAEYEQLGQRIKAASEMPFKGIIHLWSLEAASSEALTLSDLEQAQTWGWESVLLLLQTLAQSSGAPPPRLWLVTRGAVPVDCGMPAIAQSPLWALGRVVALEYPDWWGGLVDLAPASSKPSEAIAAATALLSEIADSQGEDHLALRGEQRYVARLVPSRPASSQESSIRAEGTYLITGGLGALGLRVAQWLVKQGARSLVLVGRRAASDSALEVITSLEQAGAKVLVAQADVADLAEMTQVIEKINAAVPPLCGVIHTAGTVGNHLIQELDLNTFEAVLRPKVMGGWILHQLTQSIPLDCFVCFSSIASVWGAKGQAHYATANHFLDALAGYRQKIGLPALTVNWGPWAEGGMVFAEAQQWLTRMGVKALPPDQALTALGLLFGSGKTQTVVANVDWLLFKNIYEARGKRPLLERLTSPDQTAIEPKNQQSSKILQQLASAPKLERLARLIAYLQTEVAAVLRLPDGQLPDPDRGFFDLGMDSLMSVELKTRLEASLGKTLPETIVFELPTIQALAEHLGQAVLGWDAAGGRIEPQAEERSEVPHPLEQLAESEVEAAIAERLATLERLVRAT
jgi:malonyl CoA-acyl carrier protein transacylase